jgi:hypothetical protein
MRNRYGRFFAKDLLPWGGGVSAAPAEDQGGAWGFDPQVTRWLALGADFRFAWLFDRLNLPNGMTTTAQNQFFPMQLDLYVGAELGEHVILYADAGLLGSRSYEAFGILHWGLNDARRALAFYVKAGHFFPTYGLRLDNHIAFIRERLGFGALTRGDGIAIGLSGSSLTAEVAYFLGGLDPNNISHAVTVRVDYALRFGWLRIIPGVSFMYGSNGTVPALPPAPLSDPNFPAMLAAGSDPGIAITDELRAAGHLIVGLGRFRYLGEIDVVRQGRANSVIDAMGATKLTPQGTRTALASYSEVGMLIRRGIDVGLTHEWIDPDTSIKGLANPARMQQSALNRIGAVAHWNPFAGAQLQLHYFYSFGDGKDIEDTRSTVVLMLHMFL